MAFLQGHRSDWGLQLPAETVSRRVSKTFAVRGKQVLAELEGPGCIRRIWVTGGRIGRELILRIYFDDSVSPHVEAPLADFFGVMHNLSESSLKEPERQAYTINTPFIASKPHNGFTSYLPMPFATRARVEVENDTDMDSPFFYIIDWHYYPNDVLEEPKRFCARWRREAPVRDYADDYLLLDADGPGRLVGFFHSIDMLHSRHMMRWSHAGSDNIYIDGNGENPAFLRGIGGEDTFGTSYGGHEYFPQTFLYSDMPYYVQKNPENDDLQKLVGYRFFHQESISFQESLQVRFGARSHDIASTVYWYSERPVRDFTTIPPYADRLPKAKPRRRYDALLPDYGSWWLLGPFPTSTIGSLTTDIKPTEIVQGRRWKGYRSLRGFVDFNHAFRPLPSNANSATLENTCAIAHCTLSSQRDTQAILTFGWDDHLSYSLNGGSWVPLGDHSIFNKRSVEAKLREGDNHLLVLLTNTQGLSQGGWAFSFCADSGESDKLLPHMQLSSNESSRNALLNLAFGAGFADAKINPVNFAPRYSEELAGSVACESISLVGSPQSEMYVSQVGPLEVTLAVGDGCVLGFEKWSVPNHSCFGEANVQAEGGGELTKMTIAIVGLPAGTYQVQTYHRSQILNVEEPSMVVEGATAVVEHVGEGEASRSLNMEKESDGPLELVLSGTGPIAINRLLITTADDAAPSRSEEQ